MGDLIPILVQDYIPHDKFRVNTEIFMRLAPMIAPVMHRVNVYVHYFEVPYRLLFDNWEDFITGGEDGLAEPTFPKFFVDQNSAPHFGKGSLADYLGIPPIPEGATLLNPLTISALPFRAYQLIYNEYYRDQNLSPKVPLNKTASIDQDEIANICAMRQRAWEKDYFTSCLPWAQKGGEVGIPVDFNYKDVSEYYTETGATVTAPEIAVQNSELETGGNVKGRVENLENEGVSVNINELRKANRLQEWLEKNARGGSRYSESVWNHFGIKTKDSRIQRPTYLGGGKAPVTISEVLNQAGSQGADPALQAVGEMAGHGTSVGNSNRFKQTFTEHGLILGIMSTIPRTAYQQGISRHFTKFDKFQYAWPSFAHLGEQEVHTSELYHDYTVAPPAEPKVFGYQSRYSEYKFQQSSVHGDFRDNLSYWHMGQIYEGEPALNDTFVTSNPTHRIFAVEETDTDKLYVQLYNNVKAVRPLPLFGTPNL